MYVFVVHLSKKTTEKRQQEKEGEAKNQGSEGNRSGYPGYSKPHVWKKLEIERKDL